jgi:Spy/CpxP family protein refolding chaperone
MFERTNRATPVLAALLLAGTAMLAAPLSALAQSASTATPAAPTAPAGPAAAEKAARKPIDKTEARIEEMHAKLRITPEQNSQWKAFVDAERDSAREMSELIEKRASSSKAMTAIDDFKSYEAIAEAHASGLGKVVPAFEKLYSSLSDEQKKTADVMFRAGGEGKSS